MAYLLDADFIIQALAGRPEARETLHRLAPEGVATAWVTVGEVYEGAFRSSDPQLHLEAFRDFLRPLLILGLDDPIMERFAEIRTLLRRRGQLISDFDIVLGAIALSFDLTVLTYNLRHLGRIPNLKLHQF